MKNTSIANISVMAKTAGVGGAGGEQWHHEKAYLCRLKESEELSGENGLRVLSEKSREEAVKRNRREIEAGSS